MSAPIHRVVAVTGHRPQRLGFKPKKGTTPKALAMLDRFALHIFNALAEPDDIWRTGGQRGWDLSITKAALDCCPTAGIGLTLFLPFPTFSDGWKADEQIFLEEAKLKAGRIIWADEQHPTSKGNALYLRRNDDMLGLGTKPSLLVALWDGQEDAFGGTYYTIMRADELGIPVMNVYDSWKRFAMKHAPELFSF